MANDEIDALDALEKEAKEYDKVCTLTGLIEQVLNSSRTQK